MSTDSAMSNNLVKILNDIHGSMYDVTIVCSDGHQITANQILLSSASKVFEAMFGSTMKEAKTKTVKIEDISSETMSMIAEFLESGKLPELDDLPEDEMIYALEKYDLKCMKKAIANKLQDVDVEDLCSSYELLKKLNMEEVKRKLAKQIAFRFSSFPLDQITKLDSDACLWIAQSLKDHLGTNELKAAVDVRKDLWKNFFDFYNLWLCTKPVDGAMHVEEIMQMVEISFDEKSMVLFLTASPLLDHMSPWLAGLIRKLVGLESLAKAEKEVWDHQSKCIGGAFKCRRCGFEARSKQFHSWELCYESLAQCSVCKQEISLPDARFPKLAINVDKPNGT